MFIFFGKRKKEIINRGKSTAVCFSSSSLNLVGFGLRPNHFRWINRTALKGLSMKRCCILYPAYGVKKHMFGLKVCPSSSRSLHLVFRYYKILEGLWSFLLVSHGSPLRMDWHIGRHILHNLWCALATVFEPHCSFSRAADGSTYTPVGFLC